MLQRRAVSRLAPLAVLGLGIVALASPAGAQYLFGQNKVIYSNHEWKVISTPRLDIYYYPEEQELAEYEADFAERTCIEYETYFKHKFEQKIPLVLYASHHDFKQTNIIDNMISDYVGGFTEWARGRVAIPHTGSFTQLRTVTRHELVHAFMNDKLTRLMNSKKKYNYVGPPLWFTEGLAEYVAMRQPNTEARMFLRDLVVNDNLVGLPDLWRISGSFLMYKEGESLVGYIADRYGDVAINKLLENWWFSDRFEQVLQFTVGTSAEDLDRDWKRYLKRRYYPAVMASEWPEQNGKPLTKERGLNTRPAVCASTAKPDGSCDFVYLSSSSGNIDLMVAQARGKDRYVIQSLVRGGRSDNIESIPAFASGPQVQGDRVAFTSKSGEGDALFIWDLKARREVERLNFASLISIDSPTWSPDGKEMVFSGLDRGGWSDLYRVELASRKLTRLTHDPADDRDPDWSADGKRIAWSSDRDAPGVNGVYHIFMLELENGSVTPITSGEHEDTAPQWGLGDTALLFGSDLSGANNVYLYEFEGARLTQATATLGGLFTPQWTPDGKAFLATSFSNTSFNIYRFPVARLRELPEPTPLPQVAEAGEAPTPSSGEVESSWIRKTRVQQFPKRDYNIKFGLDFVRTAVSYDPDFLSGTGGQLGFTDMLGNHQLYVHVSNSAEQLDKFWRHLNVGVTYTNLSRRLNYSVGAFHLTSLYDPGLNVYRYERRYGALFGLSYPLSRFRRVESTVVARIAELDADAVAWPGVGRRSLLVSNFTSFVHDNTMWSYAGPIDGLRLNLTVGETFDLTGTRRGGTSLNLDVRNYQRLPMRSVLATRAIGRSNWGDDVHYFFLGGPFDLRGYNRRSLFARRLALFNNELRFPLVDRLLIGLPFNSIEMGGIRGALFSDAAYIGAPFSPGWYGNFGAGVELGLGAGLIARWDFGRTHDFHNIQDRFTRFFLGWDY